MIAISWGRYNIGRCNCFAILRVVRYDSDQTNVSQRVLLVDDVEGVRNMMRASLEERGFDVVPASGVTQALKLIATQTLDVVITDLHMPNPGDGFTVVTAMRHSQPNALTLLVSGFPDVQSAMSAILLEADEIMVKPFAVAKLTDLLREKMLNRKPAARPEKERVGTILRRCIVRVVEDWLARAKQSKELNHVPLSDDERTGHLPKLVEDLIVRLGRPIATAKDSDAVFSAGEPQDVSYRLRVTGSLFTHGFSPIFSISSAT